MSVLNVAAHNHIVLILFVSRWLGQCSFLMSLQPPSSRRDTSVRTWREKEIEVTKLVWCSPTKYYMYKVECMHLQRMYTTPRYPFELELEPLKLWTVYACSYTYSFNTVLKIPSCTSKNARLSAPNGPRLQPIPRVTPCKADCLHDDEQLPSRFLWSCMLQE